MIVLKILSYLHDLFCKQDLQKEIDGIQEQIAALNDLKSKMATAFPDADTSDIDQAISELNQRVLAANQDLGNRQSKLENALLACGKFRDALQSLLDWLAETRELVENQGPIAAVDPNVMKAQMQEQKVICSQLTSLRTFFRNFLLIYPNAFFTRPFFVFAAKQDKYSVISAGS